MLLLWFVVGLWELCGFDGRTLWPVTAVGLPELERGTGLEDGLIGGTMFEAVLFFAKPVGIGKGF